jgi:nitronate monooxygenase
MALSTAFTERFGIQHPIALAPMGGAAGGALAAAVCEAGGLGLVGGGREDPSWLDRELAIVTDRTTRPWGVGFQAWSAGVSTVERALSRRPAAVMLSFGDPAPFIEPIRAAGSALIIQVTDLAEAEQAVAVGADLIVAQGTEAGGHSGGNGRSTLSFVPVVVDLVAPTPVLAAGGIADGRGLAAALALGAAGVLLGTLLLATTEALVEPSAIKAIIDATGEDTERGTLLDVARGAPWPSRYPARTLRHPFVSRWHGREQQLAGDDEARARFQQAVASGELPPIVWASQSIDLITGLHSAAELVRALAAQAEDTLTRLGSRSA